MSDPRPPAPIRSICVFCGSHDGNLPLYGQAAVALGQLLAQRQITLVYGGAHVGTMGRIADAALSAGGQVVGVMPRALIDIERAHTGLSQLIDVDSMHARKAKMAELSDGCIVLPGGIGTLDEFFEVWTAAYLGDYKKPVGLLNINAYYDGLIQHLDAQVVAGFLPSTHRNTLLVAQKPTALLEAMQRFEYVPGLLAG
jgi:uncharacterized protein (TIGR00730 family)